MNKIFYTFTLNTFVFNVKTVIVKQMFHNQYYIE
jgi:hypothetical protein